MAATTINVSSVYSKISDAKRQIQTQEETLQSIDNNINSMQGIWESKDQEVYAERFKDRKQKINEFNNSLNQYLDSMRTYVDNCVSADDQTSRELNSVSW